MSDVLIQTPLFELSKRETVCFSIALAFHCLLFFWKGGIFNVLDQKPGDIGEALVVVGYQSEIPSYPEPGAPGVAGAKRGIMKRVVEFFKKAPAAETPGDDVAMGKSQDPIAVQPPAWNKVGDSLVEKQFSKRSEFTQLQTNKDALANPNVPNAALNALSSMGSEPAAPTNLKEKVYQVAKKDMPFQITKARDADQLSNVNMVPMAVGNTTDKTIKSMDMPASGGASGPPVLQERKIGGRTSGGFSGSSRGGGSGGDELSTSGLSGGGSGGPVGGGGIGTGLSGSGSGGGGYVPGAQGQGSGGGFGSGGGGGKGGYGFGVGSGSGGTAMLPRRTVAAEPEVSKSEGGSFDGAGFRIMGALANRPIVKKMLPAYEMDARVALRFRVDSQGNVLDGIILEQGSGYPSFDRKVISALQQWLFSKLPPNRSKEVQEGVIIFNFKGV